MYEQFYGLREHPFDLTPNPRFLYLGRSHREGLSGLRYGLSSRGGITLLLGEAGTGKTALVHAALEGAEDAVLSGYLANPALTRAEFLEFLAVTFALDPAAAPSKVRLLAELRSVLIERRRAGRDTALIVDDAQDLPDELLDEIRWLTNLDTATERLLPMVLVGQPELAARLNEPGRRQLKQRVTLRVALTPLAAEETADYVRTRIGVAGGDCDSVFTDAALDTICEVSRGFPRTISIICDNALVTGFAADERPVDRALVLEVCRDLDLHAGAADGRADDDEPRLLDTRVPLAQLGPTAPHDAELDTAADEEPDATVDEEVETTPVGGAGVRTNRRMRLLGLFQREGNR